MIKRNYVWFSLSILAALVVTSYAAFLLDTRRVFGPKGPEVAVVLGLAAWAPLIANKFFPEDQIKGKVYLNYQADQRIQRLVNPAEYGAFRMSVLRAFRGMTIVDNLAESDTVVTFKLNSEVGSGYIDHRGKLISIHPKTVCEVIIAGRRHNNIFHRPRKANFVSSEVSDRLPKKIALPDANPIIRFLYEYREKLTS